MKQTPSQIAADVAETPYVWPGGYQRFALTDDGGFLCPDCCKKEADTIAGASRGDGWYVVGDDYLECAEELTLCDHCGAILAEGEGEEA